MFRVLIGRTPIRSGKIFLLFRIIFSQLASQNVIPVKALKFSN